MLSFLEFCSEQVDPVQLATRASRRFGTRTSFGKWDKVERGGYIPLSHDARKSGGAAVKLDRIQNKLGSGFEKAHSEKTFHISELQPTQSHVKTSDHDRLKSKIDNKSPDHIHVVTHKGVHYVADGHHAVLAARLRGERQIQAKHINLDHYK